LRSSVSISVKMGRQPELSEGGAGVTRGRVRKGKTDHVRRGQHPARPRHER
jgi:hypothetical protein